VTSANVRSSARKSGKRSVASASTHDAEVDVGEVVALGHHLRADEHAARRASKAASTRAGSATSPSRRKTVPSSSDSRRSVPVPWRAIETEPHASQRAGTGSRCPQ
jgi:hypothetical protein